MSERPPKVEQGFLGEDRVSLQQMAESVTRADAIDYAERVAHDLDIFITTELCPAKEMGSRWATDELPLWQQRLADVNDLIREWRTELADEN